MHFTIQYKSVSRVIDSRSRDGDDRLHVVEVVHAGLAVSPALEDRLYNGAHREHGVLRDDGLGNNGIPTQKLKFCL